MIVFKIMLITEFLESDQPVLKVSSQENRNL